MRTKTSRAEPLFPCGIDVGADAEQRVRPLVWTGTHKVIPLWGVTYFASGASALGDLRGLARVHHPIGVSIPALGEPALRELEALAGWTMPVCAEHGAAPEARPLPVLVDTGAFSEVNVGPAGLEVVAPIDDAAWATRVAVELRLARALGPQAYLVAPDRVGDQEETLRRLTLWAPAMREARARGARIIVPIQRGARPQAAFDAAAAAALGFDDFVRGVPSNKDAMPQEELDAFLSAVRPARVHFLGSGPSGARYPALLAAVRRLVPEAAVSCDSNPLAAKAGRTNGRGGAPRALTLLSDQVAATGLAGATGNVREVAVVLAFGPAEWIRRAMETGLIPCSSERAEQTTNQLDLFDRRAA